MKHLSVIIFSICFLLSGCLCSISELPLETSMFDPGLNTMVYVRPSKIKLLDIDGPYLDFDMIGQVELTNPTSKSKKFDVVCFFYKGHNRINRMVKQGIKVTPGKTKLIIMRYYVRDRSMNGYRSDCSGVIQP